MKQLCMHTLDMSPDKKKKHDKATVKQTQPQENRRLVTVTHSSDFWDIAMLQD